MILILIPGEREPWKGSGLLERFPPPRDPPIPPPPDPAMRLLGTREEFVERIDWVRRGLLREEGRIVEGVEEVEAAAMTGKEDVVGEMDDPEGGGGAFLLTDSC
jgi:hypothetical protein